MFKTLTCISVALVVLAACDRPNRGIQTLGSDFVKAFRQAPNDTTILDPSKLRLVLTPRIEPFNP